MKSEEKNNDRITQPGFANCSHWVARYDCDYLRVYIAG
jgi:hypothetical protein